MTSPRFSRNIQNASSVLGRQKYVISTLLLGYSNAIPSPDTRLLKKCQNAITLIPNLLTCRRPREAMTSASENIGRYHKSREKQDRLGNVYG